MPYAYTHTIFTLSPPTLINPLSHLLDEGLPRTEYLRRPWLIVPDPICLCLYYYERKYVSFKSVHSICNSVGVVVSIKNAVFLIDAPQPI